MFASRYFPDRYFAPRYWPKVGDDVIPNPEILLLTTVLVRRVSGTVTLRRTVSQVSPMDRVVTEDTER